MSKTGTYCEKISDYAYDWQTADVSRWDQANMLQINGCEGITNFDLFFVLEGQLDDWLLSVNKDKQLKTICYNGKFRYVLKHCSRKTKIEARTDRMHVITRNCWWRLPLKHDIINKIMLFQFKKQFNYLFQIWLAQRPNPMINECEEDGLELCSAQIRRDMMYLRLIHNWQTSSSFGKIINKEGEEGGLAVGGGGVLVHRWIHA